MVNHRALQLGVLCLLCLDEHHLASTAVDHDSEDAAVG
jgi:hypothetical protein